MADRILVSTTEMNATVGRYQQAQHNMADAQKSMNTALMHLDACWKGPAWLAMMAKWTEIEGNIARSQLAINRTIMGLKNTITEYENAENENKGTAAGLSTGTASTIYVE